MGTHHPCLDFATIYSGYAEGMSMQDIQTIKDSLLPYTRSVADQVSTEWVIVDVLPPIACHGGTRGSTFGLQRMQNSTVNVRDSRFILVWTLDRDSYSPTSSRR